MCIRDRLLAFGRDLAHHALDVVDAVFFHCAAVELVEVLAGGTHVNVEHIHVRIRVLVPEDVYKRQPLFLLLDGEGNPCRA